MQFADVPYTFNMYLEAQFKQGSKFAICFSYLISLEMIMARVLISIAIKLREGLGITVQAPQESKV